MINDSKFQHTIKVGRLKLSIRFCGMLEDFSELERGNFPPNSVMLKEGDDVDSVMQTSIKQSLPMLIVMVLLSIVRIHKGLAWSLGIDLVTGLFALLVFLVMYVVLIFAHELIHALFYPRAAEKEIWIYQMQAALIYCNDMMSRKRFIIMCLAPTVVLGFLPFIAWMLFAQMVPPAAALCWMGICWVMIFGGVGDFYNVRNVLDQVPKTARVFNFGLHTYWVE